MSAHGLLVPIDARKEVLGHGPLRQLSLEQALHALDKLWLQIAHLAKISALRPMKIVLAHGLLARVHVKRQLRGPGHKRKLSLDRAVLALRLPIANLETASALRPM